MSDWKLIWKWDGPQRIRSFLWLTHKGRLLTNSQRHRRHLASSPTCSLCNTQAETILHSGGGLLFHLNWVMTFLQWSYKTGLVVIFNCLEFNALMWTGLSCLVFWCGKSGIPETSSFLIIKMCLMVLNIRQLLGPRIMCKRLCVLVNFVSQEGEIYEKETAGRNLHWAGLNWMWMLQQMQQTWSVRQVVFSETPMVFAGVAFKLG